MQSEETKNLPAEKESMKGTPNSKEIAIRPTTIKLERLTRPMDEYEVIQVEEYASRAKVLREGVLESMSIIDSSASVLHSQMTSLLKMDDQDVRRPGEWATGLAIQCGEGIADLIRAKTEAMRILK